MHNIYGLGVLVELEFTSAIVECPRIVILLLNIRHNVVCLGANTITNSLANLKPLLRYFWVLYWPGYHYGLA